MALHFARCISLAELAQDFEAIIKEMRDKVEAHLGIPAAAPPNLVNQVVYIEKTGLSKILEKDKKAVTAYNTGNAGTWRIGKAALMCFIASLAVSTIALILLISP